MPPLLSNVVGRRLLSALWPRRHAQDQTFGKETGATDEFQLQASRPRIRPAQGARAGLLTHQHSAELMTVTTQLVEVQFETIKLSLNFLKRVRQDMYYLHEPCFSMMITQKITTYQLVGDPNKP